MSFSLQDVVAHLDEHMFDPANMVVVHYLTRTGAVIAAGTAMIPADPLAVPPTIANLKPVRNGPSGLCRLEIGFVTVQTSLQLGTHHLQFLQSFSLEQGQQAVVTGNLAVVIIHGYIGPDPMTLNRETFIQDIVHTGGFEIPCIIVAPAYAETSVSLGDQTLYDTVRNQ